VSAGDVILERKPPAAGGHRRRDPDHLLALALTGLARS
jgi:hypothetical protein